MVRVPAAEPATSNDWHVRSDSIMKTPPHPKVHTLEYFRACISGEDHLNRTKALFEIGNTMGLILDRALKGDEACGFFWGEWLPFFRSKKKALRKRNKTFRNREAQIKPSRFSRSKKDAIIRPLVSRIVNAALRRYRWHYIAK